MSEKIDPDLFAQLMNLPGPARHDLLEFLGQTPVADSELQRLIDDMAKRDQAAGSTPKPS